MKNNILLEVKRVKEIMGLYEQRIKTIVTSEEWDVPVPVPRIKGTYRPGDSDPSAFIGEALVTILQAIQEVPGAREKLKTGELQLKHITVEAGASNVWDTKDGATNYDVDNDYKPTTEGQNPNLNKDGYEKNVKLAKNRASRFIDEISPLLAGENINISQELSKAPAGVVVDTGGKLDGDRIRSEYPNPGQVLYTTLGFVYTDKEEFVESECLPEVKIIIGTRGKQDGHICDEAVFKVSVNGTQIGIANLNNAGADLAPNDGGRAFGMGNLAGGKAQLNGFKNIPGRKSKKRYSENDFGGWREWETMINTTNPELNWGESNKLTITPLVQSGTERGGKTSSYDGWEVCNEYRGFGPKRGGKIKCGSHTEVPYVKIENTPEIQGKFVRVYGKYPNVKLGYGDMSTVTLLTLNECGVPVEVKAT